MLKFRTKMPTCEAMMTSAVLRRLTGRGGRHDEAEALLVQVRRIAERDPHSMGSHPIRLDDGAYATIDLFGDDATRRAHLVGAAAQLLASGAGEVFDPIVVEELLDVEAWSTPETGACWIRLVAPDGVATTVEWEPAGHRRIASGRVRDEVHDVTDAAPLASA